MPHKNSTLVLATNIVFYLKNQHIGYAGCLDTECWILDAGCWILDT